jgi:hypothetical protein
VVSQMMPQAVRQVFIQRTLIAFTARADAYARRRGLSGLFRWTG